VAALSTSVAPSLASEYAPSNGWLTQDTANPTGKGPVTTGPGEAISDPRNGTAPVALNTSPLDWTEPELAVQAPDYLREPAFPHAGPWTPLPERFDGKEPFGTLPDDGITPLGYYKVPEVAHGFAHTDALLPGHDRHGRQVTDTAGWEQYTPSGRTAVRQAWKQHYPGVDNWWPVNQPNMAQGRRATGGNQEIHGVVAQYGDLSNSGGNTVYEPPAPPAVSQQPAGAGPGSIPQWGF